MAARPKTTEDSERLVEAAPAQQPPSQPQGHPVLTGVGATLVVAGANAAALSPGAAVVAPVGLALSDKQIAKLTASILARTKSFLVSRKSKVTKTLRDAIEQAYPERTRAEIDKLVQEELSREDEFIKKMLARLERDLPQALAITDIQKRRERVRMILDRERRYVMMREEAMFDRSLARAKQFQIKQDSPLGAYWSLNPAMKTHTPGCILMAGKFWSWKILDHFHPPLHTGCGCELLSHGDAVAHGFMGEDELPDFTDELSRAREAMKADGLIESAVTKEEWQAWLGELQEAHWAKRYPKGTAEGGEFMPARGAVAHEIRDVRRALLRSLVPELPPVGDERLKRGRHVTIAGRKIFIPEYRHFERRISGHTYTSPPWSTRVYRDGRPYVSGETGLEPGGLDLPRASTASRQPRRELLQQIHRALKEKDAQHPPISPGEKGAEVHAALRKEGFLVLTTSDSENGGMRFIYVAPDGTSKLGIDLSPKDARVERVRWRPRTPKEPGTPLGRPPHTWAEFSEEIDNYARRQAALHGHKAFVSDVLVEEKFDDHAGEHDWSGNILFAPQIRKEIVTAAVTRRRGAPLTEDQKRGVWAATNTGVHEALHAANPASGEDYHGAAPVLEEALIEELSRVETAKLLQSQDQHDVVQWIADHPTHPYARGSYTIYRHALDDLMNGAKIAPEDREQFVRSLLFDHKANDRPAALADAIAKAAGDRQEALDRVTVALEDAADLYGTEKLDSSFAANLPAADINPSGHPDAFEVSGYKLNIGDKVSVRQREQQDGRWTTSFRNGTIAGLDEHGPGSWTAQVFFNDGSMDYTVLPKEISAVITQGDPYRSFGSQAESVRVGSHQIHEGQLVRYGSGSQAKVVRILRDSNPQAEETDPSPGWVIEAVTTEDSSRPNQRVILTPERVGGVLEPARPNERLPASDFLIVDPGDGVEKVDPAIEALDKVLSLPIDSPRVSVHVGGLEHRFEQGTYETRTQSGPVDIRVASDSPIPNAVLMHETGHFLDDAVLSVSPWFRQGTKPLLESPEIQDAIDHWREVAWESESVKELARLRGQGLIPDDYAANLQSDEELFARSFSQWVATRSESEQLLADLAMELQVVEGKTYVPRQWSKQDFEAIAKALDELFRAADLRV